VREARASDERAPDAAGTAPSPDALELTRRIEALPVEVRRVTAGASTRPAAGYGEGRPSAVVRVEGGGAVGVGESVAWTPEDQARFAARCPALLPAGRQRVWEIVRRLREATDDRYERAALELAVIDLALTQRGTNLFQLAGRPPRPVMFLLSFPTFADPGLELRRVLAVAPGARVKLDVDPDWPEAVLSDLAGLGAVAVLDCKLRGDGDLAERVHAWLPEAMIEDPKLERPHPWAPGRTSASLAARVSFDAPVRLAEDIAMLPLRPAAVNVKPARMGGLLEALRAIGACQRAGIATYVGGMFEVGPGRSQVQVLASLFSPEAWNDVAPIPAREAGPWPRSPLAIPADFTGLGFA
jgi:L-alanine-DL-glutamate epimerase-like enolase superfamily enzyme